MNQRLMLVFLTAMIVALAASVGLYMPAAQGDGGALVVHGATSTPPAAAAAILAPVAGPPAPPAAAPAIVPPPTPDSPIDFLGALTNAARSGAWLGVVGLLLVGLVWLIRREEGWIVTKWKWLGTPRGGSTLAAVVGGLAELAADVWAKSKAPPGAVGGLVTVVGAGLRAQIKGWMTPNPAKAAADG